MIVVRHLVCSQPPICPLLSSQAQTRLARRVVNGISRVLPGSEINFGRTSCLTYRRKSPLKLSVVLLQPLLVGLGSPPFLVNNKRRLRHGLLLPLPMTVKSGEMRATPSPMAMSPSSRLSSGCQTNSLKPCHKVPSRTTCGYLMYVALMEVGRETVRVYERRFRYAGSL